MPDIPTLRDAQQAHAQHRCAEAADLIRIAGARLDAIRSEGGLNGRDPVAGLVRRCTEFAAEVERAADPPTKPEMVEKPASPETVEALSAARAGEMGDG
jgi:hypothetical protein